MTQANNTKQTGLIAFFANNPVAANLMMAFIIIMGILSYLTMQRQMFPNIDINHILINAAYPGASPQEIEQSILIKIEESLKDVTEITKIVSTANRNSGVTSLEIDPNKDLTDVLDKVKLRVDGIVGLPNEMEPLTIYQQEFRRHVIELTVVGDLPLSELKTIAMKIEDELLQLNEVALVDLKAPKDEIAIEIRPEALRRYDLTLQDVSIAINKHSANFSAGQIRTDAGVISVRVQKQLYQGSHFEQVPIKLGDNGSKLLLRDIAVIKDGFTEGERYFKYSGKNGMYLSVNATKDQNIVTVAKAVKNYVKKRNQTLPADIEINILVDMTHYLNARLDMMLKNLLQGSILVAIMLGVFLRFKLAMWVMLGLPSASILSLYLPLLWYWVLWLTTPSLSEKVLLAK